MARREQIFVLASVAASVAFAIFVHSAPLASAEHGDYSDHARSYADALLPEIPVPKISTQTYTLEEWPGRQVNSHADSAVKWTDIAIAVFTGILGLCSIGSGIISYYQWGALNAQDARLKESIDKAETASAQRSLDMQASIAAINEQSAAARVANKLARETLVASQRPWISVQASPGSDLEWRDGLIAFRADFVVKNTGSTPATNVVVHSELVVVGQTNILQRQKELVAQATSPTLLVLGQGINLFPNDTAPFGISMAIPKEKVDEYVEWVKTGSGESPTFLDIKMIVFVVYRATIDGSIHTTAFNTDVLEWRHLANGLFPFGVAMNKNIRRDTIGLPYSFDGNFAN